MFTFVKTLFSVLRKPLQGPDEPPDDTLLIPHEALIAAGEATDCLMRCLAFWPPDPRELTDLLPESVFVKVPRLAESDRKTGVPYLWNKRPDDWTTKMDVDLQDPALEDPPAGSWSFHLRRLGPVALAEAHDYLAARERHMDRVCNGPRLSDADAEVLRKELEAAYDGRGLVWYSDLVGFDSKASDVLPSGDLVFQTQMFFATVPAADPQSAADQVKTHMERHFGRVEIADDLDGLIVSGHDPKRKDAFDNLSFEVTVSETDQHLSETPVVEMIFAGKATRRVGPPLD